MLDCTDEAERMIQELKEVRSRHRAAVEAAGMAARNAAIVPLRERGYSLSDIADAFQISRERVRVLERQAKGQ
jgi:DNA-directed RNA polymerase sigma subunit (sigma70/sigma32)